MNGANSRLGNQIEFCRALMALRGADTPESAEQAAIRLNTVRDQLALPCDDARDAILRNRLGLDEAELAAVILFASAAHDPALRRAMSSLDDEQRLTAFAIQQIIFGSTPTGRALRTFGAEGVLRRLHVIEVNSPLDAHETAFSWTLSTRVLAWLLGDDGIAPELQRVAAASAPVAVERLVAASSTSVEQARAAMRARGSTVIAHGPTGTGRRSLLAAAAHESGISLLEIDSRRLAKDSSTLSKQLRMIARECKLLAKAALLRNIDALIDDKDQTRA